MYRLVSKRWCHVFDGFNAMNAADVGKQMLAMKRKREQTRAKIVKSVDLEPKMLPEEESVNWGRNRPDQIEEMAKHVRVINEFITKEQEQEIDLIITSSLSDQPWESAHSDQLIRAYREIYVPKDGIEPLACLNTLYTDHPLTDYYHFLEYKPEGYVKPHLDNRSESNHVVIGLSLLDTRIMTLEPPARSEFSPVEIVLRPRSVYILTGPARHTWLHGIDYKEGTEAYLDSKLWYNGGVVVGSERKVRKCVVVRAAP
eukprot:TRINITY_DN21907_c0_g1_i1.p1 TRINITY_DN21907_c0_g1~~TRINITY_DN21907_c0_g1_i1.p1  ORF type:complete len:272 (+),score=38.70 TRINITY_DN21907_c0_g1_i1:46-816(+)